MPGLLSELSFALILRLGILGPVLPGDGLPSSAGVLAAGSAVDSRSLMSRLGPVKADGAECCVCACNLKSATLFAERLLPGGRG